MFELAEQLRDVAGVRTHWREAPAGDRAPILYVHGVPTGSWDWLPYMERTGGVAPDLPGFAESEKPADFSYSIDGYADWLEAFVDSQGLDRFSLVVHDWGSVGLALAQRRPDRVERLVMHTCVPFLPGYEWHWVAKIWRTPVGGEIFNALASKWGYKQISRQSNVTPGPLPAAFMDRLWGGFDRGTRRAILDLYRSSPPDVLAAAGSRLGTIDCPTLILWPTDDPYLPAEFGQAYADAIGSNATLEMIPSAGHWMWLDRPEVIDKAARFLLD